MKHVLSRNPRRFRALAAILGLTFAIVRPSVATVSYVQGTSTNPSTGNPVSATFASAQNAGDLNVVVVGWNDTTSTVTSIVDSKGNVYTSVVGPVSLAGIGTQRIYYASNVAAAAAGTNTVTVTFSGTVAWPNVRIVEYSGITSSSPFDVGVSATGTGTVVNSGSLTTTYPYDLLVASDYVANTTSASDPTYVQRFITAGGETVEDKIVSATGAYSAGATQTASGKWLMQLAAFRGTDTVPPTSPSGLTPTVISSTQINVSWTASTDIVGVTGYQLERCAGASCTTFAQISAPATTSYNDTALAASTNYSYRVRAVDAAGNLSGYSNTASATTISAIAYVQGTSNNPSAGNPISATFAAAQNAGDLNVVVVGWNDTTSSVSSITDTQGNVYTSVVGPVSLAGIGTQRIYYAKNIAAAGAGVNTVTVTFSGTVNWPNVRIMEYRGISTTNPFDVGVSASGTGTTVNSGSLTTTNAYDLLVASDYVANTTSASDPTYVQRFITAGGETVEDKIVSSIGAYSAGATQTTSAKWLMQLGAFRGSSLAGDTTPPTTPSGLTPTVISSTQINVSWTASTDNVAVTGYRVERCTGAGCTTFAQIGAPATTTFSDTGLLASTSYTYRVRATDAAGNLSTYSSTASGTTSAGADTTPPTAPSGLGATVASATQINLSWTGSTDNVGVTGYRVESCSGASCTTFAQIGTPTATTYSASGLTASTSYSFRVRATDAAGNLSGYSNIASGTTQAVADTTPPSAPGTPTLTIISASQINLSWNASTDNVGVTGYRVESCSGASCSAFAQVGTPTTTSYSATGLAASTAYSFRVRATDAAGNLSSYSGVGTTTIGSASIAYTYDANGRIYSVTAFSGTLYYHYDAVGNVTSISSTP